MYANRSGAAGDDPVYLVDPMRITKDWGYLGGGWLSLGILLPTCFKGVKFSLDESNTAQIHITLMVLNLEGDRLDEARDILRNCRELVNEHYPIPPRISFRGVGTFGRGRVVWAAPVKDEEMTRLVSFTAAIRAPFTAYATEPISVANFTPHATLMKIKWRGTTTSIPEELYAPFRDYDFGTHTPAQLELSAMMGPKAADGYYMCEEQVVFGGDPEEDMGMEDVGGVGPIGSL
ncbi:A-kinase anchor protein 7 isoforms alpha and beta [Borealophlyctis nickersoniae]|nr:A-kinase anchor protein 7 isoforms alpha and beta [Borealophlyctis nickersoniae]